MMATGEPDALMHVTADVEMRGPMGEYHGRDQVRAQLSDWRDGLSDVEIVIQRTAVDGAGFVVEWHLDGSHTGAVFLMEDMLFEGTGRHIGLDVTTEVVFRDRQICSLRHAFDLDDLVRQLRPEATTDL